MTGFFRAASLVLIFGIVIPGCTSDRTSGIQRGVEDLGKQAPTDCSAYAELSPLPPSNLSDADRLEIRTRFRHHYSSLNPRVMRAEARQILLNSSKSFGNDWAGSEDIVSKFDSRRIAVFVYTRDPSNIEQSKRAIQNINDALGGASRDTLQARFIQQNSRSLPISWAKERGIHLYFGSEECMWEVFDRQANVSKEEMAPAATFNLKNLGGITLTQELVVDGKKTGQLLRSLIVILNLPDSAFKQNVIEHELMHALGVKGHTRSILWSRMSQEAGSVAPLPFPSSFDRQILALLYSKLSAGDSAARVDEVLEKEWDNVDIRTLIDVDKCVEEIGRRQNGGETVEGIDLLKSIVCRMEIEITARY